ncbi:MAG TPA: hypothetical protein VH110_03300 [Candidatus Acidoferrum sp.]|nr:hypothetical protein [Candidatus Acidoferrum sp.]
MGMDIRLPIGILFSLLGSILVVYGFLGDASGYRQTFGVNINLDWGLALLVFGLVMFLFGRLAKRDVDGKAKPDSPEASRPG